MRRPGTIPDAGWEFTDDVRMTVSSAEGPWMAEAPDHPPLRLYPELGVQFVEPDGSGCLGKVAGGGTVPDHPGDVILCSLRGARSPEEMATQPTYRLLPAVQAGQVHPWEHLGMDCPAQTGHGAAHPVVVGGPQGHLTR